MHEKLIRWSALLGLGCFAAAVFAFVYRAGVYGCPVAEGCDVPVRTSNHPYTDVGILLVVVGVAAVGLAVELRRRGAADNGGPLAG